MVGMRLAETRSKIVVADQQDGSWPVNSRTYRPCVVPDGDFFALFFGREHRVNALIGGEGEQPQFVMPLYAKDGDSSGLHTACGDAATARALGIQVSPLASDDSTRL
eukprot:6477600-Amphidinium_carterae.1